MNKIQDNFFINDVSCSWPIDDGSCYYNDTGNILVYGGFKSFLGHSLSSINDMYIFTDIATDSKHSSPPFCASSEGIVLNQSGFSLFKQYL